MRKLYKITLSIIVVVMLFTSLSVSVVSNDSFIGTIQVDENLEGTIDFSTIEIQVYSAKQRSSEEDILEFDEEYIFSVYPNDDGIFTIDRPTSYFSLSFDLGTLPKGTGIDRHTAFYLPNQAEDTFSLSKVENVQIVPNSHPSDPQIVYYNSNAEKIFAEGRIAAPMKMLNKSILSEQVSLEGTVDCGESFQVSEILDLSDFSEYERLSYLNECGYISNKEKIENYCTLLENGTETGSYCLTPIIGELTGYYSEYGHQDNALDQRILDIINPRSRRIFLDNELKVADTNFMIHYDSNVVDLDTAMWILGLFNEARETGINLGYNEPYKESGEAWYHVYVTPDEKYEGASVIATTYPAEYTGNTASSYIVIWNITNWSDRKIVETVYHEYYHGIQYTYNCALDSNTSFLEGSANWFCSAFSGYSSNAASFLKRYLKYSDRCILTNPEEYGTSVLEFAIQKTYDGEDAIRRIWEELSNYPTDFTDRELFYAINNAIHEYDTTGDTAEAFKKCAAWSLYADYFFEDFISGNINAWNTAEWKKEKSGNYVDSSIR